MRKYLYILAMLLLTLACASDKDQPSATESSAQQAQGDDGGTSDGTTGDDVSNQPDDGRRPIEDSEGIPGYLHDPSKLVLAPTETATELAVTAPIAETPTDIRPRDGLTLTSYSVRMVDLLDAIEQDKETVAAKLLESVPISDNGFSLNFPDPYPNVVIITTAPVGEGTSVTLASDINTDITYSQSLREGDQSFIQLSEITAVDIRKRFIAQADVTKDGCFTSADLVQLLQDCTIDEVPPPDKRYCDLNGDGTFAESDINTPENLVVYETCAADL